MMHKRARASGIGAVGELPWGSHFCQFYHTREDLIDTLVPYFKAGLENNEYCLWVTSEPLPTAEAKTLLAKAMPGLDAFLARDQLEICDIAEWYTRGNGLDIDKVIARWLERERQVLQRGFAGLRLTGNTFWLERHDWNSFMEYEEKVQTAFARRRVFALCTYCLEKCTARDVLDVVRTHQFALVRRQGAWELIESSALNVAKEELQRLNEQLEQRVSERTRELENALRGRDEFLALLAHGLRNPMAPILNGAHVLELAGDDRATREQALEMVLRQVRHLKQVIDDLLDVSRITRGKVQLRSERLDLGRLVRALTERSRVSLERAGLSVAVELPETPVWVQGDVARLAQVFTNLIDNASKFTRVGRVEVQLRAEPAPGGEPGRAVLTVRDTGVGIDGEVLPRLFQPFGQPQPSSGRPHGGLGLGLSVVQGLVALHGGTVEAASEGLGRGATFTVRLPLEPEPAALSDVPADGGPEGKGLRVLVVEDNMDAARSLKLLLSVWGHEIRLAHTGLEGIRTAAEWHPEVVVSDIGLPGADGFEVARQVRRQSGMDRALLIALTGYGSEDDRRQSREAGFDHHLTKPADPDTLQELIATWATGRVSA
jgi:signal transduction histidine kinase